MGGFGVIEGRGREEDVERGEVGGEGIGDVGVEVKGIDSKGIKEGVEEEVIEVELELEKVVGGRDVVRGIMEEEDDTVESDEGVGSSSLFTSRERHLFRLFLELEGCCGVVKGEEGAGVRVDDGGGEEEKGIEEVEEKEEAVVEKGNGDAKLKPFFLSSEFSKTVIERIIGCGSVWVLVLVVFFFFFFLPKRVVGEGGVVEVGEGGAVE